MKPPVKRWIVRTVEACPRVVGHINARTGREAMQYVRSHGGEQKLALRAERVK